MLGLSHEGNPEEENTFTSSLNEISTEIKLRNGVVARGRRAYTLRPSPTSSAASFWKDF
jgi:hypothetical protein